MALIFFKHLSYCNFSPFFRLVTKDGKKRGVGFTLVEMLTVIAILGTLSSIAVPAYSRYVERTRITACIAEIRMLERGIFGYEGANGNLPNNLNNIGLGNVLDPWGNPYQYLPVAGTPQGQLRKDRFLVPLNSDFDLYSMGKDGISLPPLTAHASHDDILRANDGGYVGLASEY
ncbi:MAG: prepilin-type N-terminal cleavage/methylation domain-containing protein [Desulfobacteraceae bacterium]|nr:MAG: prepilin-type N-terminal cleavage/methylation domain-containing protein [Desulfobacteraceae bacterium]